MSSRIDKLILFLFDITFAILLGSYSRKLIFKFLGAHLQTFIQSDIDMSWIVSAEVLSQHLIHAILIVYIGGKMKTFIICRVQVDHSIGSPSSVWQYTYTLLLWRVPSHYLLWIVVPGTYRVGLLLERALRDRRQSL